MALSQAICSDSPAFLVDRRNPLPRQRQELLVEISVLVLRDSLLEQAAAGLHTCGGQRSLLLRQRKDEWPIAETEAATP